MARPTKLIDDSRAVIVAKLKPGETLSWSARGSDRQPALERKALLGVFGALLLLFAVVFVAAFTRDTTDAYLAAVAGASVLMIGWLTAFYAMAPRHERYGATDQALIIVQKLWPGGVRRFKPAQVERLDIVGGAERGDIFITFPTSRTAPVALAGVERPLEAANLIRQALGLGVEPKFI